jgi:hypothetical protein
MTNSPQKERKKMYKLSVGSERYLFVAPGLHDPSVVGGDANNLVHAQRTELARACVRTWCVCVFVGATDARAKRACARAVVVCVSCVCSAFVGRVLCVGVCVCVGRVLCACVIYASQQCARPHHKPITWK